MSRPTARARRRFRMTRGKRILNIDIGGGTTKLGIVESGDVIATAALHIGRLAGDGRDRAASCVSIRRDGFTPARRACIGRAARRLPAQLDKLAGNMAICSSRRSRSVRCPRRSSISYLTDPIGELTCIDGVMFSGGGRRIRLWPRGAPTLATWDAARPRDPRDINAGRVAVWPLLPAGASAPRARCLPIQRPAQRQYQRHLETRRASAAANSSRPLPMRKRRSSRTSSPRRSACCTAFDLIEGEGGGGARAAVAGCALT